MVSKGVRLYSGPLKVLMIGACVERKNHMAVIEAVCELNRNGIETVLKLVGRGPLLDTYPREDYLHYLGHVTRSGIEALFDWCDVFAHPSKTDRTGLAEGLGLVVIEAFEREVPVVCTTNGGLWDVTFYGKFGTIIKEDASTSDIMKALVDAPLYDMKLASWATIFRYGVDSIRERLNTFIRRILNG